jgi:hypothetical protein
MITDTFDTPASSRRVMRGIAIAFAGIILCLILAGQALYLTHAVSDGSFGVGTVVKMHGSTAQQLRTAVGASLGTTGRGVPRFRITDLRPDRGNRRLWDAGITWQINNDLYAGTVGNGAEGDVYAMLRSVYGAHLPIASLRLTGVYPLHGSGRPEVPVMRLSMDRQTAQRIDQMGWDTVDPETVWPMVTRSYVAPQFQPLSSDG